jgi:Ca-activated chloride channel family protein
MLKYLLAFLLLVTPADAAVTDANVLVLLDTSGSMQEGMGGGVIKMQAAQEALVNVLDKVPESTNIGVLTFAGWAFELAPVTERKADLIARIRATTPSGGTPLAQYTKIAGDSLLNTREKNRGYGTYKLLIVTDGESSDNGLMEYVSDLNRRGVVIETIGVKMKGDHALSTRTKYMRADDPNSLKAAVGTIFAETHVDKGGEVEEGFDAVSGLTDDLVKSMIVTMIDTRNYPVGDTPPPEEVSIVNAAGERIVIQSSVTPAATPVAESGGWGFLKIMMVVCFVICIVIVLMKMAG